MRHNKKKGFWKIIWKCIKNIAALCTIAQFILEISIAILSVEFEGTYTVQEEISTSQLIFNTCIDYFLNNWLLCIFNLFYIILFVQVICIPFFAVFAKKIKPRDAKPHPISMTIFVFLMGCLFCYHLLVDVAKAYIPPIIIIGEDIPEPQMDEGNVSEPQIDEDEQPFLTEKEKVVSYIIRSKTEVIPINEWNTLSDTELYYIRNGIFADCGQGFPSDYYDEFSWYDPKYSSSEVWYHMDPCQRQNIENIRSVEK